MQLGKKASKSQSSRVESILLVLPNALLVQGLVCRFGLSTTVESTGCLKMLMKMNRKPKMSRSYVTPAPCVCQI